MCFPGHAVCEDNQAGEIKPIIGKTRVSAKFAGILEESEVVTEHFAQGRCTRFRWKR